MNQIQAEVIFLNLLRQSDEFVFSILGTNPTPDAGSFRARVSALYSIFNADKYNFVQSPTHLGFLATLIKEYGAFRKSEITQIGTPEILIGQIRWEDIYDKPDILAASSDWADITNKPATYPPATHAHDYASITDKPATFPPATHAHDYASITDKPATFPPATHGHAYADITEKPATYPPATHGHAYADITETPATFAPRMAFVTWTGNGNATRAIAFTGDFIAQGIVATTGGGAYARMNGTGFTANTINTLTITTAGVLNASGTVYYCLILG